MIWSSDGGYVPELFVVGARPARVNGAPLLCWGDNRKNEEFRFAHTLDSYPNYHLSFHVNKMR